VGRVLNSHLLNLRNEDDVFVKLSPEERFLYGDSMTSMYNEHRFDHTIVVDASDKLDLVAEFYINEKVRGTFVIRNLPRDKDVVFVEMNNNNIRDNNDLRVNLELSILYFDPVTYEKDDEIPKEMMELVRSVRTVQRQKQIRNYEREINVLRDSLRVGRGVRGGGIIREIKSSNDIISLNLKTNQAASEAQIDYLNRLITIHAKLLKMTNLPSCNGGTRDTPPIPPSQSMLLRDGNHIDIHRRQDGDVDLDIGDDVHIHMHRSSSPSPPSVPVPPPLPHENFDVERWLDKFVNRFHDGMSYLDDDGGAGGDNNNDTNKQNTKRAKLTSPTFEPLPDAHLGTNENQKSPQTTARLMKSLRHRLVSEKALRRRECKDFKAEIEEKNAALEHFKKRSEKQRRKIEDMKKELELMRSSEIEIQQSLLKERREDDDLNRQEYGEFLKKMMKSCSEATARAVRSSHRRIFLNTHTRTHTQTTTYEQVAAEESVSMLRAELNDSRRYKEI